MENINLKVEGEILTITVDLTKDFGRSASGKTIIVASTHGNLAVPGHPGFQLGLNIYKK